LLLFIIVYAFSRRQRPEWSVAGLFMLGYGVFRFLVEFFRQPDSHLGFDALGWITRGQLLSAPMIIGGLALMIYAYRREALLAAVVADVASEVAAQPVSASSTSIKKTAKKRAKKKVKK
jgi:phosphatidylglycerol:prolipoprotein diacylglycerol transferase